MTASLRTRPMTVTQARALFDRIKRNADELRRLVVEIHEGKAWEPLGYKSFKVAMQTEFGMSEQHAYRILAQAKVINELAAAAGATNTRVSPSHRQTERIKPQLPEVTAEIKERVQAGEAPGRVVPEVIQTYGAPPKIEGAVRPSPAPSSEAEEPEEQVALTAIGSGPRLSASAQSDGEGSTTGSATSDSGSPATDPTAVAGPAPSSPPTRGVGYVDRPFSAGPAFDVALTVFELGRTPDEYAEAADTADLRVLASWCHRNLAARGFEDPHQVCRAAIADMQRLLDEARGRAA